MQAPNLLMICTYTLIKLIALFLEMLPVKREISHSSNPFKTIWNPFWGALKRFSCLRRERGHLDTIIYKYYTCFWFPLHLLAWSPGPLRYRVHCRFDTGLGCFFQMFQFSLDQSFSHVRLFATPWTAARQASLSITSSQSLLKLMSIESVMPSNHRALCRPLPLLPSVFPGVRVFSNESGLHIR